MKYPVFLFFALFILSTSACGQRQPPEPIYQKVLPGSSVLQASRITPHRVTYEKATGGSMIYDLHTIERDGREVYELYIYFNTDETGTPDKMYFDPVTLGYIGRRLEGDQYTIDVQFSEGRFTGELIPAEGSDFTPRTYDKAHPHGAFEPAIMNYWITALPLEEGYTASIPVFDLNDGSQLLWSNIEVLKKETVAIDGADYETWKVRSDGIREKTIWVSTTEPYAIQMETGGVVGTWKVKR